MTDNTFPSQDFYTFATYSNTGNNDFIGVTDNYNGPNFTNTFNNVFMDYARSNKAMSEFFGNTFVGRSFVNDFGSAFALNVFYDECVFNIFRDNFYQNTALGSVYGNIIGKDVTNNTFNWFQDNIIGNSIGNSTFGNGFQRNIVDDFSSSIIFGVETDKSFDRTGMNYRLTATQVSVINSSITSTYLATAGDMKNTVAGGGIYIKEGVNATMGVATLVGGTVTVSTTKVTANSRIFLTTQTVGGTIGTQYISARVAGTSFTITSTSATDTSVIAWQIVEPS
mgnify:FL=1